MPQLTFFDVERNKAIEIARNVATRFAASHSSRLIDASDFESEAVVFALEYYKDPDFKIERVAPRVRFHLNHRLDAIDRNVRRSREGRRPAETNVESPDETFAARVKDLPIEIAIEVGALINTYSPPVSAAITDVLNGYSPREATKRNKLSKDSFWGFFTDFQEKVKFLL